MTKYHLNKEDQILPCKANKKVCEFADPDNPDANHYYSMAEAYGGLADRHDEQDILAGLKKKNKTFTVEDSEGNTVELVGGELTDAAKQIFRSKQFLALAVETSKVLGNTHIAVITQKVDLDDIIFDHKGKVVEDQYGSPITGTKDVVSHAYAVSAGGTNFYDVDGPIPSRYVKAAYAGRGIKIKYTHVSEIGQFEDEMDKQNYELASTFTNEVLSQKMDPAYL